MKKNTLLMQRVTTRYFQLFVHKQVKGLVQRLGGFYFLKMRKELRRMTRISEIGRFGLLFIFFTLLFCVVFVCFCFVGLFLFCCCFCWLGFFFFVLLCFYFMIKILHFHKGILPGVRGQLVFSFVLFLGNESKVYNSCF